MINKINIIGEYLLKDKNGIIIGGKKFIPNLPMETSVDEETFLKLKIAQQNGWFSIKNHNYIEFLESRNRKLENTPIPLVIPFEPVDNKVLEASKIAQEMVAKASIASAELIAASKDSSDVSEEISREAVDLAIVPTFVSDEKSEDIIEDLSKSQIIKAERRKRKVKSE